MHFYIRIDRQSNSSKHTKQGSKSYVFCLDEDYHIFQICCKKSLIFFPQEYGYTKTDPLLRQVCQRVWLQERGLLSKI